MARKVTDFELDDAAGRALETLMRDGRTVHEAISSALVVAAAAMENRAGTPTRQRQSDDREDSDGTSPTMHGLA